MRVVLTGGGTSGHVVPFEPIIVALRTQFLEHQISLSPEVEPQKLTLYFAGVVNQTTKDFFSHLDIATISIPSGKLRRYASGLNIIDLVFWLPLGIVLALIKMFQIMPEVVISKGGYGSIPVVLAAVFFRIPVLVHESDVMPGMANSFIMRFASAVTLGFAAAQSNVPKKYQYKTIVTGTPVRQSLFTISQAEAKNNFNIQGEEKVLLVMGGSQGAQQINETLLQILPKLILNYTIIHVTGENNFAATEAVTKDLLAQSSRKDAYKIFPYLHENIGAAISACDGVVSRAGSSVGEFIALRKPMLLIPLASAAGDHQRLNAQVLEANGAALVLDPNNLGVNLFEQNIERLMTDETLRKNMIGNMAILDKPQAARDITTIAYKLAQGLAPDAA